MTKLTDFTQRFLIEKSNIRGEWVRLQHSLDAALDAHGYQPQVESLLAETILASILMSSTLKFDGKLIFQAQGSGPVTLLTSEATNRRTFRAIARYQHPLPEETNDFRDLLGNAHLAITIAPEQGQRYQGIVAIDMPTLSQCLEQYFESSEQLKTFLFITVKGRSAVGLLLQKLPSDDITANDNDWEHIKTLAHTLKPEETLVCDNQTLLHRLFHEEAVTIYPEQIVQFECSCSNERSLSAIKSIGQEEALSILEEQINIDIKCEFCSKNYLFDRQTVLSLFNLPSEQ